MRVLQVMTMFGYSCAATSPNVMYFRNHNMDRSSKLSVSTDSTSVTLNEWDTTINQFDSKTDVTVQRIDVLGAPNTTVPLYSSAKPLLLSEGPIYFFHNATFLTIRDVDGKSYSLAKTDAVVWLSKGSCLHFSVELGANGVASLMAVTSGKVQWSPSAHSSGSCGTSTVLVGAGTKVNGALGGKVFFPPGPGSSFYYNEVPYTLTGDSCDNPLTHSHNGYSQTDQPIGPLDAHFHTRGTLYYTQYGASKYNDEAAPNDTIYTGELRFVNMGVYYGPEEMNTSVTFVSSVHEADPAAVDPVAQNVSSECPFACMNKLKNRVPSRCAIKSQAEIVV